MDLTSRKNIKKLLKAYQLRPSRKFGQNFLVDRAVIRKVIEAADPKKTDSILEIGPGLGALTQELAQKAKKVVAVEKDRNMVKILRETLKGFDNVEVVQEDILKLDLSKFWGGLTSPNYKVVGNLPFYLTAPAIRKFLETKEAKPLSLTLVVQKEVGQRICAKPPRMNLLAVSVQVYAKPKIISYVSKKSFWPEPDVDAAIIKITPDGYSVGDRNLFFKIVRAGFSQPRKQLINNLSRYLKKDKREVEAWLLKNNIQPTQRAETLDVQNWLKLTKSFKIKQ